MSTPIYLTDEGGNFILTEDGFRIIIGQVSGQQPLVNTEVLTLPLNCVMADDVDHEKIRRLMSEHEIPPHRIETKPGLFRSGTARLSGAKPSFTVKTSALR